MMKSEKENIIKCIPSYINLYNNIIYHCNIIYQYKLIYQYKIKY